MVICNRTWIHVRETRKNSSLGLYRRSQLLFPLLDMELETLFSTTGCRQTQRNFAKVITNDWKCGWHSLVLVNFTGEVKPFVPGFVDRQTPVDFSDDVTWLPRIGSQLPSERRTNGTLFLQDETQMMTVYILVVEFYIFDAPCKNNIPRHFHRELPGESKQIRCIWMKKKFHDPPKVCLLIKHWLKKSWAVLLH